MATLAVRYAAGTVVTLALFLGSSAARADPATVTVAGVTLRSVDVGLPGSDRGFPEGAGMDVVTNNCTACHSAGMVLTQPPLPQATWQAEVDKMRATYKAPVAAEDVPTIVAYLTRIGAAK